MLDAGQRRRGRLRASVRMLCLAVAVACAPSPATSATDPAENLPEPPAGQNPDPAPATSPTYRGTTRHWSVAFGAFLTTFDTKVRWDDKTLGPGTTISLEDDLGLTEDVTKARLDFALRTGKRSALDVTYLRLRRSAVRTLLDSDIQWDDKVFRVGATVESDFDTDVFKISWGYALVQKSRFRFGMSAGLSTLDIYGSIRGVAEVDGSPGAPSFREEETEEVLAPVPVLGLHVSAHLAPRLMFRAFGQLFTYDEDEWEVDFLDTLAALEYVAFDHVSFGAGYDYFRIEYAQSRYDLHANYTFKGLMFYVRVFH